MHDTGKYTVNDLIEVFSVSRPTIYRTMCGPICSAAGASSANGDASDGVEPSGSTNTAHLQRQRQFWNAGNKPKSGAHTYK